MTPFMFFICALPFALLACTFAPFMRKTARLSGFRLACLFIGSAYAILMMGSMAFAKHDAITFRDIALIAAGAFVAALASAPLGRAALRLAHGTQREPKTYQDIIANTAIDAILGFPMLVVLATVDYHILHTDFALTLSAVVLGVLASLYLWCNDTVDVDELRGYYMH